MKNLKWLAVFAVIIYAGWIAFPVMHTYMFKTDDPFVPRMSQDNIDYQSRMGFPSDGANSVAPITESIQGETAIAAIETQNIPVIFLWAGVIVFYLLAAFLQANNNLRAAFAYALAFMADIILTYLTKGQAGSGIYDKMLEILSAWDPRYVVTLAAMVMIFMVVMTSLNRKKS